MSRKNNEDMRDFTLYRCPNNKCKFFKAIERKGNYQREHLYVCPKCGHSLKHKRVSVPYDREVTVHV